MSDPFRSQRLIYRGINPKTDLETYLDLAYDWSAEFANNPNVPLVCSHPSILGPSSKSGAVPFETNHPKANNTRSTRRTHEKHAEEQYPRGDCVFTSD